MFLYLVPEELKDKKVPASNEHVLLPGKYAPKDAKRGDAIEVFVCRNKHQLVAFFVVFFDEKIGGKRVFAADDVDKGLHHFLMAAMPGSSLPSMASSKAPPPVLT